MAGNAHGHSHHEFGFGIRYIHAALPESIPHESVISVGNHFRPPTNRAHFGRDVTPYVLGGQQYNQNQVFIWQPGRVSATSYHFPLYQSTSLFWCSDRSGYLLVPFDCTRKDVEPYPDQRVHLFESEDEDVITDQSSSAHSPPDNQVPLSWRRMTFARNDANARFSRVGYHQEYFRLGARVPNSWSNFLVPPTQSIQGQRGASQSDERCQLAGDLGALIGLCAFTSSIANTPQTIQDSFRPHLHNPQWQLPQDPIPFHERTEDKGVIVDIYRADDHGAGERLKQWENGHHGPILT